MARDYAQIFTAIWKDDEFRALPGEEQRVYLLLTTQGDISACGVLPLRVKKWARMSGDGDSDALVKTIESLAEARYVIVDWDEEELLVRSFVRWDKAYGNPKRRPVIITAAGEVTSQAIRDCLAVEFERVGLPPPDGPGSGAPSDQLNLAFAQVDSQSHSHGDSQPHSHGDSERDPYNLQPGTNNLDPSLRSVETFDQFWDTYAHKIAKKDAQKAWCGALKRGADPSQVIAAAERYARTRKPNYVAHAATWLNGERWNDQPPTLKVIDGGYRQWG